MLVWTGDAVAKEVVAACAWFIWRSRCNVTFNKVFPNLLGIFMKSWSHAPEYSRSSKFFNKELSHEVLNHHFIVIYTEASWLNLSNSSGLGFVVVGNFKWILLAGAMQIRADSPIMLQWRFPSNNAGQGAGNLTESYATISLWCAISSLMRDV